MGVLLGAMLGSGVGLCAQALQLSREEVVFGQPFEVVVVAADKGFDPAQLEPLVVEELARELVPGQPQAQASSQAMRIRYRARAYQLGEVTLGVTPERRVRVVTCLPDPPGELEWPSAGFELQAAGSRRWWIYALLLLGVGFGLGCWRRGRGSSLEAVAAANPGPTEPDADRLLAELRSLAIPAEGDAHESYYLRIKEIVRTRCQQLYASGQDLDLSATVRTSEELVATLPQESTTLAPCLLLCDRALFGGMAIAVDVHLTTRDHAVAFVQGGERRT